MVALALARGAVHGMFSLAGTVSKPIAAPRPTNDRGVPLDAQTRLMLTILEKSRRPTFDELGADRARVEMAQQAWLVGLPEVPLHRVEDRSFEGETEPIPVRIYTPQGGVGPHPGIVYFHGGGFVIGDLESHDLSCRQLADRSGATVIAVHYRRAPEHPFPAAPIDACSAFRWVYAHADELHLDPARIAVAGDSAGGNLAAVVCQQMREEGHPMPSFQLLIYPATDLTRSCESHETFEYGYFLTRKMMDWFMANYLTTPGWERDPRGSPLITRDLSGLPPAHIVVAGFDPLRDEGEAYAQGLMAAGVPTTIRSYASLIHGFYSMGGLVDAARWAGEDIAAIAKDRLHG